MIKTAQLYIDELKIKQLECWYDEKIFIIADGLEIYYQILMKIMKDGISLYLLTKMIIL